MASELPITHTVEAEIEQIACVPDFVDINDILNRGIREEARESKPFSEYGYLENKEDGPFYDSNPYSSEFEVMLGDSVGVEDHTESKFSPSHFWENTECNGLAGELANPKVNHHNNGIIVKNGDNSECTEDLPSNSVEWKMETLKTEYDIGIIYEDIIPQIEPNCSHKHSIDSEIWPQQNIDDGTALERDKDTRKESTIRINSKNSQMIQKLPHCKYPKLYPSDNEKGEKPFQCKVCPKSFAAKSTLLHHEIIHIGKKPFQCQICSKSFSQRGHLTEHVRIHTGEKPFQCKVCSKSFAVKRTFLHHEIIHTGKKPFQCEICPKSFASNYRLLNHERTHTEEKPFQCTICLKLFLRKRHLTEHEKFHTGEKPFQCKVCSKPFSRKSHLRDHDRIHTGEKPFQCKVCPKSFGSKSTLLHHEKIHTREKPVQCKVLQ